MPLFEYACKACDRQFEFLVRGSDTPECPSCKGTALERRQSTFAARTASAPGGATQVSMGGGGCGACGDPCGPGACSMN